MASLHLFLLGPFQAFLDGKTITGFGSNKTRALLAYLAVESDRPHPRDTLAGLLWPEHPQVAAMNSLRTALATLRQAIGDRQAQPPFLRITREAIQINPESNLWVDVEELEKKIDLYRGEFLEGFSLEGSPAFEEWLLAKREYYQRQALKLLHGLAEEKLHRGEYEEALGLARRQVEMAPWLEEAHRQAMRLLALSGQRSAALAQYQACCKALMDELGVEPAEETTPCMRGSSPET